MESHTPTYSDARREFIKQAGLIGMGLVLPGEEWAISSIEDKHKIDDVFKYSSVVKMNGYIGKKLDQSYNNRIIVQDVDHLIQPFRNRTETRMWQSEFWGKWFTSAVLAYKYRPTPELKKILDNAVKGLLATQTPDGYIGNYKPENRLEQWDVWGMKYCMLGLLDYYDLTNDKTSLAAASRLADYLIKTINEKDGKIVNKGNYRGMAASSVLEPVVRLYNATSDKKYLAFSEDIVRQWETNEGPQLISKSTVNVSERFPKAKSWYSPEQGMKAYEMMSCYEGLLELYRVTGNSKYLEAVENTWQNIRETEINIAGSGASEEMWFGGKQRQVQPVAHFQETCVTVTWIKLNQQLLRLTGNSKYADEVERSYYNSLLGSLNEDASDWAKYTPLNGERLPGSGQCGMDLNCCNASGPRGQFTLPLTTVMSMKDGISINFYVDGSYDLQTPKGKKITVVQKTNYPSSGKVMISLLLPGSETMKVQLRIPSWSKINKVMINKNEVTGITPGSFLQLTGEWSAKDEITLELDMHGRVEFRGDDNGKFAAISSGPVVLARDSRLEGPSLVTVNKPVSADGYIDLKPMEPGFSWMRYTAMFVPEAYTEQPAQPIPIQLIDYASAGNGKSKSVFQVWLPQLYSGRNN